MARIFKGMVLHIMYSPSIWVVHKVLKWLVETLVFFVVFLMLVISALILQDVSDLHLFLDVSENLRNIIIISCLLLSGGIAYFRSLKYKPEEKIRKILEGK
ncbi:hypothetical protein [Paenibacillus sp. FSL R7-0337]|uniref:hypothetical protein n=1 Tax=Paenibacillus sp. FSL R7-0337 TaxID=1926588 RepID=UPI00096F9DCD|nr:hypothetical protein [Paenibacillus sp. FSL R7-0337]OMF88747.1 hypothetical protein BK147_26445 [Paenibacillus sp. FSL R7-0337]